VPPPYEPRDDPLWVGSKVGAQQGLGFELSSLGSRINTQRNGHGGQTRAVYQMALSETISTVRCALPYQLATVIGIQTVFGSSATTERLGSRLPFLRGLPS